MITKLIKKVPAGLMVVPLIIASVLNTFFPQVFNIGSFSHSFITNDGLNSVLFISMVCVGAQLTAKRIYPALKRGGILFIFKWIGGLVFCAIISRLYGLDGVLGISLLAFVCALTNQNNSLFIGLMAEYGDDEDLASAAITAIIAAPMITIISLYILGLGSLKLNSILDIFLPIFIGAVVGNLDENASDFLNTTQGYIIPFMGFSIGLSINLKNIFRAGISGIILGIITIIVGIIFMMPAEKKLIKRPGYTSIAMSTTAGNAMIAPQLIASFDEIFLPYVETATTQVASAVIITALVVPIITGLFIRKKGEN